MRLRAVPPPTASRILCAALVALALWPGVAPAQQAGVVTGVVRDSASARPLAGATITLVGGGAQYTAQSDAAGLFQLFNVQAGSYDVTARRLGYELRRASVDVATRGARIDLPLARVATLDTVRVGPGMAIYGAVGSYSDLRPLGGVEVQVVGTGARVKTDSAGRFIVPVNKPGVYVVRARLAGFDPQTLSAPVPKDNAVEISILLDAAKRGASPVSEMAWGEFGDRVRARGNRSALVSRSELLRDGNVNAFVALEAAPSVREKNLRFGEEVCTFVDGLPAVTTPIWKLEASAIEAVEVYTADSRSEQTETLARKSRGSECHRTGNSPSAMPASETIKWVVVWLKR
jgi:hypothetical protein